VTTPCLLYGQHPDTVAPILLSLPLHLGALSTEKDRLSISSWSLSIACLWDDWRYNNVPTEFNHWDSVATTIIWMIWYERNQQNFWGKSSSILELIGRISSLLVLWQANFPLRMSQVTFPCLLYHWLSFQHNVKQLE